MIVSTDQFNPIKPLVMHIDINSCFATCEQQANPFLRGKPIAVAAYVTDSGCLLSPSIEAKKIGIKVGMRVLEAKQIYRDLIVLAPDPEKYRFINHELKNLLNNYTPEIKVKSIDEMVLNFTDTPVVRHESMLEIAKEIKKRIRSEIGEWLRVSIGISTNYFLAKTASGLHKPDGLDVIDKNNIITVLKSLILEDLYGIKKRNSLRLNNVGIFSTLDFYQATPAKLTSSFKSIVGYYWYLRLHGFEIDDFASSQKTYGQSYALSKFTNNPDELSKLLCKLVVKMGKRLRDDGMSAKGIHIGCLFSDNTYWHHGKTLAQTIFSDLDLYQESVKILFSQPLKLVKNLSVACFHLEKMSNHQLSFLERTVKNEELTKAIDQINNKWGDFSITPALMMGMEDKIVDRIAFGQ